MQRVHETFLPLSASRRMTTRQTCLFRQPAPPPVVSATAAEEVLSQDLPSSTIPKPSGLSLHQHDIKICSQVTGCVVLDWHELRLIGNLCEVNWLLTFAVSFETLQICVQTSCVYFCFTIWVGRLPEETCFKASFSSATNR